jgi:hypothetical protein
MVASPERRILFGPNDFDETLPGPFDWDVRRLATSFLIVARERGFTKRDQCSVVRRLCETFRQRIAEFSRMDTLDVWYYQFKAAGMLAIADSLEERRKELAVIEKARLQSSRSLMTHQTELVSGKLRIKDVPPLVYHVPLTGAHCSIATNWWMRRFAWWVSGRWGHAATKRFSWPTDSVHCSFSSRRRGHPCWRVTCRQAIFPTTASVR